MSDADFDRIELTFGGETLEEMVRQYRRWEDQRQTAIAAADGLRLSELDQRIKNFREDLDKLKNSSTDVLKDFDDYLAKNTEFYKLYYAVDNFYSPETLSAMTDSYRLWEKQRDAAIEADDADGAYEVAQRIQNFRDDLNQLGSVHKFDILKDFDRYMAENGAA